MGNHNDTHRLVDPGTGTEVAPGTRLTDFRGDHAVFEYISRPPEPGKSGKIVTSRGGELYPQVFTGDSGESLRIERRTLNFPGFPPIQAIGPDIIGLN